MLWYDCVLSPAKKAVLAKRTTFINRWKDSWTKETSLLPPCTFGISSRRLLFLMLLTIFVHQMVRCRLLNVVTNQERSDSALTFVKAIMGLMMLREM